MRQVAGSKVEIPAFTYSSKDIHDESEYAKKVADRIKMPLTIREQDQGPEKYLERLKGLVKHLGRGHSSPAIVSVDYFYESVFKQGSKVAIDGQGSDELFGGYKNYLLVMILWYLAKGKILQAYYCFHDLVKVGLLRSIMMILRVILPAPLKIMGRWVYGYERFFRTCEDIPKKPFVQKHIFKIRNSNRLNRHSIWEHNLGLGNLVYYQDIVAMKNSVENRSPFMDHRLVDFVFSRSEELKLWKGIDKYALKVLPLYKEFNDVLDRKKIAFSSDIKKNTKDAMINELKVSPVINWPIFKRTFSHCINKGGLSKYKYERFLFRLYPVHLWNEVFFRLNKY